MERAIATTNGRRKRPRGVAGRQRYLSGQRALDLEGRVAETGGPSGSLDPDEEDRASSSNTLAPGIYGDRSTAGASSVHRTRLFQTPASSKRDGSSQRSRFSAAPGSLRQRTNHNGSTRPLGVPAVHIVCAVSENLARETCVASLDAGSPTAMQVTKQGNGQTYAETLAYLEVLKPDEVLLNEGRRNSPLARKIMDLFGGMAETWHPAPPQRARHSQASHTSAVVRHEDVPRESDDQYGPHASKTVVKFLSRACFDQTKGAELLRRIAREETYDATVVEEYILLSAAHALLQYTQSCLGAIYARNSLQLLVNSGGNNRMAIDRSSILQLELLVNSRTGKAQHSLIGSIDTTKTTVGSRLLRTNLMSPPTRVDTIMARQELVQLFLENPDLFYSVLEHLEGLPDVDKMISSLALVPHDKADTMPARTRERLASKGISSLVGIKSTLQALPVLASLLRRQLLQQQDGSDAATVVTDRSSLLVGLGGGSGRRIRLERHHLLRAIVFSLAQPELTVVLQALTEVFTETTSYSRNAHMMRHQVCFALKCDESNIMNVLRKAFLSNVDDIYKKADEYAEVFGFHVTVRYTATRGYFLAVPVDVGTDLPQVFLQPAKSGRYIHCTTEEVTSLNSKAQDNVHDLLMMTFDRIQEVMAVAREHYDALAAVCDAIALLDMCHSFADTVTLSTLPWCCPVVFEGSTRPQVSSETVSSDPSRALIIRNGRYAVEAKGAGLETLNDGPDEYIPNDTYATQDEKFFTVVTGINGSGKSTYLKQVAIIVILAHCGSYVPADQATIPMRDSLFCRIGHSDDQEHNISTFMLEMKETAYICNHASSKSLILVDELGRATSNEDGVAIAWAVSEFLLKKRVMTFFVTHYPQLSRMANIYPSVQNVHLEATVSRGAVGEISYSHKVKSGACHVSTDYGIELAASCGWPVPLVNHARSIEQDAESLLPDEHLCQPEASEEPGPRVKALDVLDEYCRKLDDTSAGGTVQSYDSLRSQLDSMQQSLVPKTDPVLIEAVGALLYPASLKNHCRRIDLRKKSISPRVGEESQVSKLAVSSESEELGTSNAFHVSAGTQDALETEDESSGSETSSLSSTSTTSTVSSANS